MAKKDEEYYDGETPMQQVISRVGGPDMEIVKRSREEDIYSFTSQLTCEEAFDTLRDVKFMMYKVFTDGHTFQKPLESQKDGESGTEYSCKDIAAGPGLHKSPVNCKVLLRLCGSDTVVYAVVLKTPFTGQLTPFAFYGPAVYTFKILPAGDGTCMVQLHVEGMHTYKAIKAYAMDQGCICCTPVDYEYFLFPFYNRMATTLYYGKAQ